jgi:hypothetical protein
MTNILKLNLPGMYRIARWSHITNAHSIPGTHIVEVDERNEELRRREEFRHRR